MAREFRTELEKYVDEIVFKCGDNGTWEIVRHDREVGLSLQYTRPILRQDLHVPDKRLGYYILFDGNYFRPVYVGYGNVGNRIYRFFKELSGKSRHDEDHPAARRYLNKIGSQEALRRKWEVSVVWRDELPEVSDDIAKMADELVANRIGAQYNRRTIGNSLPI